MHTLLIEQLEMVCECVGVNKVMSGKKTTHDVTLHVYIQTKIRPPLKKSLFPVQQVAIIMASREAAKSFFFIYIFFPLYRNDRENAVKQKKNREM